MHQEWVQQQHLVIIMIKEKKEKEKANKVRAQEFITEEEQEIWQNMPTPTMQRQFDQWDQQKRGRGALTTMPVPRTTHQSWISTRT